MFAQFLARLQLRRSTAFLLDRSDDRLLDDIGLTRAELQAMHLGLGRATRLAGLARVQSLPVPCGSPARVQA